jgi:predicted membrane channel-forming protein YqfA (hemolysin III family)
MYKQFVIALELLFWTLAVMGFFIDYFPWEYKPLWAKTLISCLVIMLVVKTLEKIFRKKEKKEGNTTCSQ